MAGAYHLLQLLSSEEREDILAGLRRIKLGDECKPSDDIACKLIGLLHHPDSEIRNDAVYAIGYLWSDRRALLPTIAMIDGAEKDEFVLGNVLLALGAFADMSDCRRQSLGALGRFVMNQRMDPELRGSAYLLMMRARSRLTVQEYARSDTDIGLMSVDHEWVRLQAEEKADGLGG